MNKATRCATCTDPIEASNVGHKIYKSDGTHKTVCATCFQKVCDDIIAKMAEEKELH